MTDAWYYSDEDKQVGPLGFDELKRRLSGATDWRKKRVWHSGLREWQEAGTVPELNIQQPPPLPKTGVKAKLWWAGAGSTFVALVLAKLIGYEFGYHAVKYATRPSESTFTSGLSTEVEKMKRALPKRLDEITTWVDVWNVGKQITFQYEVETDVSPAPAELLAGLKSDVVKQVCGTSMGKLMMDFGVTSVYKYKTRQGRDFADLVISPADCR